MVEDFIAAVHEESVDGEIKVDNAPVEGQYLQDAKLLTRNKKTIKHKFHRF